LGDGSGAAAEVLGVGGNSAFAGEDGVMEIDVQPARATSVEAKASGAPLWRAVRDEGAQRRE